MMVTVNCSVVIVMLLSFVETKMADWDIPWA